MKLGLSSYTYTWQVGVPGYQTLDESLTVMGLLDKAKQAEVNLIQVCDNLPLDKVSKEQLAKIKETASDFGIDIEVGTQGVDQEHLLKYLDIAEYLGSDILRIILEKEDGKLTIEEGINKIKKVLAEFSKKNISIAVENHEKYTSRELSTLIGEIDSPYLGICLDTVNSFGALEGPEQVIARLAPYTINLHIKDFEISRLSHQMGFTITGAPAGYGRLDIDSLLATIRNNGKKSNAILELWTPYTNSIEETINKESEWADKSIKFLRGKIDE